MNSLPPFLIQQEPRLSPTEAEKIVDEILKRLGIKKESFRNKGKLEITKNQGTPTEERIKYTKLTKETRETGICGKLQTDLDRQDLIFGGTVSMSTPNWQLSLTTEWAGYKKVLQGPCRNIASEIDLSEDIEFYKEETCVESIDHDFVMSSRNYRGYLFASMALVDSYINRHILFYDFNKRNTPTFQKLKDSRKSEERIELFVKEFCNFQFDELKNSLIWQDFKKLKTLRNEMIHSMNPYMGFEYREIADNLNLSIRGVGALLKKFQEGQNRWSLGFMEKVRTSPIVHFNQITTRADGNHIQKKKFNKITR